MTRLDFPFSQIATGDLDIPIVGQLPAAKFPLSDEFEPGPVKVVGFAPGNADALMLVHADAELDDGAL